MDRQHLLNLLRFKNYVKDFTMAIHQHNLAITLNDLTIAHVISSEMDNWLINYRDHEADKETVNHRYLCLQEALYMEQGGVAPAIRKSRDEVFAELRRWRADMQKTADRLSATIVRRKVELIDDFMQRQSDQGPEAEQTKLF